MFGKQQQWKQLRKKSPDDGVEFVRANKEERAFSVFYSIPGQHSPSNTKLNI